LRGTFCFITCPHCDQLAATLLHLFTQCAQIFCIDGAVPYRHGGGQFREECDEFVETHFYPKLVHMSRVYLLLHILVNNLGTTFNIFAGITVRHTLKQLVDNRHLHLSLS